MEYTAIPVEQKTPVEHLGRLAAERELMAANPLLPEYARVSLIHQAKSYRAAQWTELEFQPQPYSLAEVLNGPPRAFALATKVIFWIGVGLLIFLLGVN